MTNNNVVLKHGPYSCAGDFAVEVAHMVSNAEAALMEGADRTDVLEAVAEYLEGKKAAPEVANELAEIIEERQKAKAS